MKRIYEEGIFELMWDEFEHAYIIKGITGGEKITVLAEDADRSASDIRGLLDSMVKHHDKLIGWKD